MVDLGEKLGNYRLTRLLGEGGFAKVYLGKHLTLDSEAAIKVLKPRLASNDLEKFRAEARTLARLVHPHIVRVLDFEADEDRSFLVMDYYPKGTLRQRYPRGTRLPPRTILTHLQNVAEALQYAHDHGFIHRDVKPENMLLGANDVVLLSDFGLAIVARSTSSQITQNRAGTLAYMAPEQIMGKPHKASDQYALGIVVYEWLCGALPFRGAWLETVAQHLQASPPPLHEKDPTILLEMEEVVARALKKDPHERFPNVQEFVEAFERAVQLHETKLRDDRPASEMTETAQTSHSIMRNGEIPAPPPTPPQEQMQTGVPVRQTAALPRFTLPTLPVNTVNASNQLPTSPPPIQPMPSPTHHSRFFKSTKALLAALALMVIMASIGLGAWQVTKYTADLRATATAHAYFTATAEAHAAAQKYDEFVTANGIMFGFDAQHMHYNPYEKVLNPSNVSHLVPDWLYQTGSHIASSPVVANGVVYMTSWDDTLYALDVWSSRILWSTKLDNYIFSSPAVANGVVYTASLYYNLYAFNAAGCSSNTSSCNYRWTAPASTSPYSSPTVANETVYLSSYELGPLEAFDNTGRFLWPNEWCSNGGCTSTVTSSSHLGESSEDIYNNTSINSSPAVANGVVYVGSENDRLYASNAMGCKDTSCKALWSFKTGEAIGSSPAVAYGVVYVGSDDGKLYTFHLPGTTP